MNCFFTVMECTFIKGFRFRKSLDLLVKAPRKIVYDYKKLKLVYCKTGNLYFNSCEILKDIKLIVYTVVNKTIQTNVKFNWNHGSLEIIYMALQL